MELFDLYNRLGHSEYIGEPVSQLEHACQTAELALEAKAVPEVVLAAFFHDIGHLCTDAGYAQMDGLGAVHHERVGAAYLRAKGLPERVALLTENHVQAKRYLCFIDSTYYTALSEASKVTLRWQGGPMDAAEAAAFEQDPDFEVILQLRKWDEQAKVEGKPLPNLAVFEGLLQEILTLE